MKKSIIKVAMATTILVSSAIASTSVEAAKNFTDVKSNSQYHSIISSMTDKGIISGYPDGTFKPEEKITRQHAAALISRAYPTTAKFTREFADVKSNNPYYKDIQYVVSKGFMNVTNGKFEPTRTITRGEMAKALVLAASLTESVDSHGMKDVSKYYDQYVNRLYAAKVTTGFGDKTFREKEGLSRAHYAVFMYRAMDYKAKTKQANKGTLFGESVFGKYEVGKIPNTTGVTYEQQWSQYDKLVSLMPKGSYKAVLSGENKTRFDAAVAQISKASGVDSKSLTEYLNETAKTGKFKSFNNSNGEKYFIGVGFDSSNIFVGEDHR